MTFDEEKLGSAFAGAEGLEKRIAIREKLAETEAQREELASSSSSGRMVRLPLQGRDGQRRSFA
jgi:hypothetical protein